MDGLLIDSEPYWRLSMIRVMAGVGLHLTEQQCTVTTGMRFDSVLEYWYSQYPWQGQTIEQVHDAVLDEMEHAILHEATILPGVLDMIAWSIAQGYRIAIASSSPMRLIRACVHRLGGDGRLHALVSAEAESHGKPHPAVFLSAATALSVSPQDCVVLEDSFNGLIAAKAAQMYCVVIPSAVEYDQGRWVIADYKLPSLDPISNLTSWIQSLNALST